MCPKDFQYENWMESSNSINDIKDAGHVTSILKGKCVCNSS